MGIIDGAKRQGQRRKQNKEEGQISHIGFQDLYWFPRNVNEMRNAIKWKKGSGLNDY